MDSEHLHGWALLALLLGGGGAGLSATPGLQIPEGLSVAKGAWSAAFEAAFSDALPHHEPSLWAWTAAEYRLFGDARPGMIPGEDGWFFTDEELRLAPEDALPRAVAEVRAVRARLREQGVELVVAVLPSKARIYEDKLTVRTPKSVADRYDALRGALVAADVNAPDLEAALREARGGGEVFLRTDTHWTPRGASAVADAIARSLSEALRQELRTTPYTLTGGPPVDIEGDLLRYLPLGPFGAPVREQVQPQLAEGESSIGLFGDATYPVVAVGTSYTAREVFGFVAALQSALGADVLELADEGQGPFAPMRAWTPGNNPPRLVVWELPERYLAVEEEL